MFQYRNIEEHVYRHFQKNLMFQIMIMLY